MNLASQVKHFVHTNKKLLLIIFIVGIAIGAMTGAYFLNKRQTDLRSDASDVGETLSKFEPPTGKMLWGIGNGFAADRVYEDDVRPSINALYESTCTLPTVITEYVGVAINGDLEYAGLESVIQKVKTLSQKDQNNYVLLLAVSAPKRVEDSRIRNYINGVYNQSIQNMGKKIRELYDNGTFTRPIIIRPLYEINSPWGDHGEGYTKIAPEFGMTPHQLQKKLYVNFVDNFRQGSNNVPNVAMMMHVIEEGTDMYPVMQELYPGNEYVDWIGISAYNENSFAANAGTVRFAKEVDTPLFIPEGSAAGFDIVTKGQNVQSYLNKFFAFINNPDNNVKGFNYGNFKRSQYGTTWFENSRLIDNPSVLSQFADQLRNPRYNVSWARDVTTGGWADYKSYKCANQATGGNKLFYRVCDFNNSIGQPVCNNVPFNQISLSNWQGKGNEYYSDIETFAYANNSKLRLTLFEPSGAAAVGKNCNLNVNTGTFDCNVPVNNFPQDNLTGGGRDRWSGYGTNYYGASSGTWINFSRLDKLGNTLYTQRCKFNANEGTVGECAAMSNFDISNMRSSLKNTTYFKFGPEVYRAYETYLYAGNRKAFITYMSADGKKLYNRVCDFNVETGSAVCPTTFGEVDIASMRGIGNESYIGVSNAVVGDNKIIQFFVGNDPVAEPFVQVYKGPARSIGRPVNNPGNPISTQAPTQAQPQPPVNNGAPGPGPFSYASCTSMSITSGSTNVSVSSFGSNNYSNSIPEPGQQVTLKATGDKASSKVSIFWMRPANAPDDACSFYVINPTGDGVANFTMPNWRTGNLKRNDVLAGQCAGKPALNFSSGIVFGVNFNNNGDNAQPRCRNYGPAKETGKLVVNNTTTAENCNNVCNILLEPAPNFTYASCKSMTMTYGGKSVNVSSTTSSNTISPAPQPGESVTLSTVPDKASSKSFFWMRPANAPDDACSFYVLDTSGNSTVTFNMPNWKGGLKRNDTLAGQCAGKPALDFSSGIVFGVNYSDNGDNTKPRCRNFGPSTTNGLLISNNANTGQSCSNICSITAK